MISKIGQIIFLILTCLFFSILQFSFISSLPGAFAYINLGLILIMFVLFFFGARLAAFYIIFFGVFMDIFSFQFFSFYLISLTIVAIISYLISENWLTNKSLYSFWVLCLVASITYSLVSSIIVFLFSGLQGEFSVFSASFWRALFYQSIWILLAASLFFNIFVSLASRITVSISVLK
jgi:hypothetical protein